MIPKQDATYIEVISQTRAGVAAKIEFDLLTKDVQDQTWVHNGKGDVSFAVINVHMAPRDG